MLPISLGGLLGDAILARTDYDGSSSRRRLRGGGRSCSRCRSGEAARAPCRRSSAGHRTRARCSAISLPLWFLGTVFGLVLTGVFVFVKRFVMETEVATVGTFFSAYTGAAIACARRRQPARSRRARSACCCRRSRRWSPASCCLAAAERRARGARRRRALRPRARLHLPDDVVDGRDARVGGGRGAAISIHTSLPDLGGLLGAPLLGWIIEASGFSAMFAFGRGRARARLRGVRAWDRPRVARCSRAAGARARLRRSPEEPRMSDPTSSRRSHRDPELRGGRSARRIRSTGTRPARRHAARRRDRAADLRHRGSALESELRAARDA